MLRLLMLAIHVSESLAFTFCHSFAIGAIAKSHVPSNQHYPNKLHPNRVASNRLERTELRTQASWATKHLSPILAIDPHRVHWRKYCFKKVKAYHHNPRGRGGVAWHHIRVVERMREECIKELVVRDGGGDVVQRELQPLHEDGPGLLWLTMRVFGKFSWRIDTGHLV